MGRARLGTPCPGNGMGFADPEVPCSQSVLRVVSTTPVLAIMASREIKSARAHPGHCKGCPQLQPHQDSLALLASRREAGAGLLGVRLGAGAA